MREVISLNCTNCGGQMILTKDGSYQCDSCGSTFFFDDKSENYIITAGKLEKYVGSAVAICIPNNVAVIGERAFANLDALESVVFPSTLTKIENEAFLACKSLKEIKIPPSVRYIGQRAFKNSGLRSVVISGDLSYFGAEAFMQCEELTEVTISCRLPKECIQIFKQCTNLSRVNIDKEVIAASFVSSLEAKKNGDSRPTYFDLFQGTPFFKEMLASYAKKQCIYCGGEINVRGVCEKCQTQYYKKAVGGCYVATCVYGSYDCPEVWTLRRYRDNTLSSTWYGRMFIRTYYAISPTLVKWFGNTKRFKKMWKSKLDRMVAKLRKKGVKDTPYKDKNW